MPQPMSPEVLKALSRGAPGGIQKPPMQSGPTAGGMMTPQKPSGQREQAKSQVFLAQKLLVKALSTYGAIDDDQGKAILKAVNTLAKAFGRQQGDAEDLSTSEKKTLTAGLPDSPPAGGAQPPGGPPAGGGAPPPGMAPQQPGGAGAPQPMAA